jgi:tetratricopeptide (TPR) repeat protein
MRFFDWMFSRQSGKVIGIILFFLILSSGTSTPQPKDTIAPNDAEAYYNRGLAYQLKKEYDKAIADYTKAIEINPNDAEAYNNRGLAYGSKKEYDKAIADYTKAIEINPKYAEAYYNRGLAYFLKKEYDKAWEDVYKAQGLGSKVHPEFLNALRKASGRQR